MNYRRPEDFKNQTVVVVGGSRSGIDVCGELAPHVKKVVLSRKEENMATFNRVVELLTLAGKKPFCLDYLQSTFSMTTPIDYFDNDTVYFQDKTSVKPDCVIFATGYDYSFPFITTPNLSLEYNLKQRYLYPLYRHMFNVNQYSLFYLVLPSLVVPFPLAELQTHLIARILKHEIKLPTTNEILQKINTDILNKFGNKADVNYSYHSVNIVEYVEQLLLMINTHHDGNYNYKLIQNQKTIRKVNRITNELIVEQTTTLDGNNKK
ncbi:unnamed protein product [Didymodactylos carnosus]|uniref:Flavin-containing monooxygenase n=1 Tax=Didymodactylos carnosus TaxID=1234261 RepID=A0A814FD91_9BILA|nr:unnamed protein product [Didymodactylos carnosus]CAF1402515.1 unnamed protein product [Didymodactylos carnosus]CAF3755899.1 unnamed protein product [Didymodactylos carnosus]CAF4209341.1 unnamed protein product [Didymodactylos carnosus]